MAAAAGIDRLGAGTRDARRTDRGAARRRTACYARPVTPSPLRLLSVVALVLVVVACAGPGATPTSDPGATPTDGSASGPTEPSTTDGPSAAPSDPATSSAPESSPPSTDEPSGDPGAAAACAGTDQNREFFASVAEAVDWTVYCPVLDDGWFVDAGQYRLAGGGWLEIAYRGPGDARIDLREGVPCDTDGCLPTGNDLGAADFGDMAGALLDLGGGRYAVVVDPGATPSWTLTATGLTEADVRTIAADLVPVEG